MQLETVRSRGEQLLRKEVIDQIHLNLESFLEFAKLGDLQFLKNLLEFSMDAAGLEECSLAGECLYMLGIEPPPVDVAA